ncbi:hypothetical protein POM88_020571 [Heracleum sosnowskyi]|uniref:Uncharacterized protein n=1 Tax=Heracleum sosnowskyi TaxID=360622 RepID=A0AAD8IC82_9APIA|nr:hypothetical protein POM88_020571 [Heracleum sosnowskyi]
MVLSTATRRLQVQPSIVHMDFAVPRESLAGSVIESTSSVVMDLNFILSSTLLTVTRANSPRKGRWFLWVGRRVPISVLHIEDDVIFDLRVSEEDAHLVDSLFGGGRNVTFSVSSGKGLITELKMKEE